MRAVKNTHARVKIKKRPSVGIRYHSYAVACPKACRRWVMLFDPHKTETAIYIYIYVKHQNLKTGRSEPDGWRPVSPEALRFAPAPACLHASRHHVYIHVPLTVSAKVARLTHQAQHLIIIGAASVLRE